MTPKRLAFNILYHVVTMPVLQTGADLAAAHRRYRYFRFPIFLLWLPVRGVGIVAFKGCKALA